MPVQKGLETYWMHHVYIYIYMYVCKHPSLIACVTLCVYLNMFCELMSMSIFVQIYGIQNFQYIWESQKIFFLFKKTIIKLTSRYILILPLIHLHYYFYYLLFESFSHQRSLMIFQWSLSDSTSSQVSRTLLSILAVLNNIVVCIFSTNSPIFNSSSSFNNTLVTVPKAPITIGIIVTFMFHSFFDSLARSFFSHSFNFILWSARTAESTILQVLFFFSFFFFFFDYYKVRGSDRD